MEYLFINKKPKLYAKFDFYILLTALPLLCGGIGFTAIREAVVGYITSFMSALGAEPIIAPVIVCMLLLVGAYSGVMSTAAFVIVPLVCAASGFAVEAVAYTYSCDSLLSPDFFIFAVLLFAYIFSVLFLSAYAMKLSHSIQGCIRSNRTLKTELFRYQSIFVLIVVLLIVSGYFIFV